MSKKTMIWMVWFASVAMGCVILFSIAGLSWKGTTKLPVPRPDAIVTSTASENNVSIENKTAGYAIVVPRKWYLENSAGSGVSVYPDYDAANKTPPDCKVEISVLSNSAHEDFADWLAAHLRSDPMADVLEISRITTTVSGVPAIIWSGVTNNVSSTLAYIAAGAEVYEIAPSVITEKNGPIGDARCADALRTILNNFHFIK
jgi:hypothetical protein